MLISTKHRVNWKYRALSRSQVYAVPITEEMEDLLLVFFDSDLFPNLNAESKVWMALRDPNLRQFETVSSGRDETVRKFLSGKTKKGIVYNFEVKLKESVFEPSGFFLICIAIEEI